MSAESKNENEAAEDKTVVEISRMKPTDAADVFRVSQQCALAYWSQIDYEKECVGKNSCVLIAKSANKTIGFIVARLIIIKNLTVNRQLNPKNYNAFLSCETSDIFSWEKSKTMAVQTASAGVLEIEAEIYNIAVLSEYRKKGVGSKLLAAFFSALSETRKRHGAATATVWLEARESNGDALDFYRAHGFEFVRRIKNFYRNPVEDAFALKAEMSVQVRIEEANSRKLA